MKYIEPLARLIAQLSKLPSVGEKTAARYAYAILNSPAEEVNELVDAIRDVKQNVHFCKICGNYTENEICDICQTRKPSVICVVKEPKDIVALEKVKVSMGVYHVWRRYFAYGAYRPERHSHQGIACTFGRRGRGDFGNQSRRRGRSDGNVYRTPHQAHGHKSYAYSKRIAGGERHRIRRRKHIVARLVFSYRTLSVNRKNILLDCIKTEIPIAIERFYKFLN